MSFRWALVLENYFAGGILVPEQQESCIENSAGNGGVQLLQRPSCADDVNSTGGVMFVIETFSSESGIDDLSTPVKRPRFASIQMAEYHFSIREKRLYTKPSARENRLCSLLVA